MRLLVLPLLAALAWAFLFGPTIEPKYVNAYTYTNLTIRGAKQVYVAEGAVVDFNATAGGAIYLGLKPLKPSGYVALVVDNETVRLPILDRCRIEISALNMTWRISVNVTAEGSCGEVKLYANGTRAPAASYIPPYSGVYVVTATDGVFYQRVRIAVVPNVTIVDNVFGGVMKISFAPPPRGGSISLGGLTLPASGKVAVDTWMLGAGNYSLVLRIGGLAAFYNVTVAKAVPQLRLGYRGEYTYGEPVNITTAVLVGGRPYRTAVQLALNGTRFAVAQSPGFLYIPLIDAGLYILEAQVAGDRNITSASARAVFRVSPAPVRLELRINGTAANPYVAEYGKVLLVDARAISLVEPRGRVAIYVDGRPAQALVDTLETGPGLHNITAVFTPASGNFRTARASALVYVTPSAPEVAVEKIFSIVYGQPLEIPIYVRLFGRPVNAVAKVELVSRTYVFNYTVKVVGGLGVLKIDRLPAGTYLGTVTVAESPGMLSARATFNVFVGSAYVKLILDVPKRGTYGDALPIRVALEPGNVPGRLSLVINGTVVYSGNASRYEGMWAPPRGGVFKIAARFESLDPNYASTENVTYVYVDRAQCAIRFQLEGDLLPNATAYVLRSYAVRVLSPLPARIYVNGSEAGPRLVFNRTGLYNVTVYFPGDDSYYPCGSTQLYRVVRNPTEVELSAPRRIALADGGLTVTIYVKSPVGHEAGPVRIYMINRTYNSTEVVDTTAERETRVSLRFKQTGVYTIYVEYLGNSYLMPSRSNPITVTVEPSYLGIPAFLFAVYLVPLALGFAAAAVAKRILKRGI
ncbi:hypothetical protein [Pyrobaculum neutrophilum]|uniref:Uncharacterized protein n=1 Tax=Pyrobaculum neutrophilum (strain DSM 2338 / JCM 9278 / NBRC 100436 / V24Sta) TaxID=444157 RepID=B1YAZ2_PYRNV|nr:hypothetical protein [Pyrobaculum neutrophilum]ACB40692.1 conserved hypothetical protein [Pyrobaculum neutrophilum V24Sta]